MGYMAQRSTQQLLFEGLNTNVSTGKKNHFVQYSKQRHIKQLIS